MNISDLSHNELTHLIMHSLSETSTARGWFKAHPFEASIAAGEIADDLIAQQKAFEEYDKTTEQERYTDTDWDRYAD